MFFANKISFFSLISQNKPPTVMNKLFLFLVSLLLSSCILEKDYVVESDYSYMGKFKKYKSFGFMVDNLPTSDSTAILRQTIESAIRYRMELQGYKFSENESNILISYKVFYRDMKYRGYHQPDIDYWVKREDENEEKYNPIKYTLREGTLVVSFFDSKQRTTIWQGYASGLFGNSEAVANQRHIKRAIRTIFDQYRFLAENIDQTKSN